MRHELRLDGHAFRLRPVALADAPLIVELRSDAERSRHLHPVASDPEAQRRWIAEYLERPGDLYFVIERRGPEAPAEGLVGVYDIDAAGTRGEWGRWILRPGSLAAVESAWLILRVAFDELGLERVVSRTVAENVEVVSFHDRSGAERVGELPGFFTLGERRANAIEHQVTRAGWAAVSARLERLAERLARRIADPR